MNRIERLENLSAYIDGELSSPEQRWLAAWCENHPEDLEDFEAITEVVRLVREVPEIEPPAGLRERIHRAVAEAEPVAATREQALEWLDKYFDHELPAPQRAVVEHYWATDPEFAETAEVHLAMLEALGAVDEAEPPADLADRIRASVAEAESGLTARPARRPRRVDYRLRRAITVFSGLALLAFAIGLGLGRHRERGGEVANAPAAVQPESAEPSAPPVTAPIAPTDRVAETPAEPVELEPMLPADDADQPMVSDEMRPEAAPTPRRETPHHERVDTRRVADTSARTRRPADAAPPTPKPVTPKTQPKTEPPAHPAPLPGAGAGRLADDAAAIDRAGHGSVLGDEAGRRVDTEGEGSVDPTRRTEVPPF